MGRMRQRLRLQGRGHPQELNRRRIIGRRQVSARLRKSAYPKVARWL